MKTQARLIAYYLPQYYPIPLNDQYWGKGFTEWTNVAKAKPLFEGHYQPHLPTELGYYDLRVPEVRTEQANLAREYGIEGFCYWHYWFGNGKRLLERPFNEVVETGEPDFPFCLCWANHTWSTIWKGNAKTIIIEQTYPGVDDFTKHFYSLLKSFKDKRYIKVNGKLLFSIFAPTHIPSCKLFTETWQQLAKKEKIDEFHFVGLGVNEKDLTPLGLDACTPHTPHSLLSNLPITWKDKIIYKLFGKNFVEFKAKLNKEPQIYKYCDIVSIAQKKKYTSLEYPVALPNWDHTPRGGIRSFMFKDSTPELFGKFLQHTIEAVKERPTDNKIVFLKAWNEWAEGNYLEPERKYGRGYLEVIKSLNLI